MPTALRYGGAIGFMVGIVHMSLTKKPSHFFKDIILSVVFVTSGVCVGDAYRLTNMII